MFDRLTLDNADDQSYPRSRQPRAERQLQDDGVSRVSTDSDLDLDSDEDEDDYRSTFSDLLMRKLAVIEQVQQQHIYQEENDAGAPPLPLPASLADDSYWAKMHRVSQWRNSTLQSETSSEYSPCPSISRKRRLSDASLESPSSSKRPRFDHTAVLSPAAPGSPFFPHARAYPLGAASDKDSDSGSCSPRAGLVFRTYLYVDALHVCTACDTKFTSRQRLLRHGRGVWTPDACRAAVTYGLE